MSPTKDGGGAQPSISRFFKRKSPPAPLREKSTANEVIEVLDDDDSELVGSKDTLSAKKSKTSGYFGNGTSHTGTTHGSNGSTELIDERPVAGPSRKPSASRGVSAAPTYLQDYRLPRASSASTPEREGAFGTFSFASSGQSRPSVQRTAAQQEQHEKWHRKVVGGNLIPRRRSLALDEAAAAEARRQLGIPDQDDADGTETPAVEEVSDSDDERQKQAAKLGSGLAAKYGAKADIKGKGKATTRKKKEEEVGPSGQTYTPLERQYMEIHAKHPDVLLLMEVGYKYKFHGEDAKIASRELGIAAFPARNFYTASIPTHRLLIHVKKLISLGYKVGVISQMETAALKKVGENRNAPFTRELTQLYTAATYVDDSSLGSSSTSTDDPVVPGTAAPPTNALLAVVERPMGGQVIDERARIAIVSVIPGTGDVVWDEFDDSAVRTELETRLTHLQPRELLLPAKGLSKATEKLLKHFAGISKTNTEHHVRVERIDALPTHDNAFDHLTRFYKGGPRSTSSARLSEEIDMTADSDEGLESSAMDERPSIVHELDQAGNEGGLDAVNLAAGVTSDEAVLALVDFPKQVVIALSVAVNYMKGFGLQNAFRHRSSFTKFINRAHMLLSSNTLVNLEIYQNQTDGGIYGSLLWLLDHCRTRMGRRLMREWIGRPLLDVSALQARIDAVDEIMRSNTYHMEKLRSLLVNMPDLVKGLTRIQYGKAQPTEVASILVNLQRIGDEFKTISGSPFQSLLLNNIVKLLPTIRETSQAFLRDIDLKAAKANEEANLWADPEKFPDLQDAKDCISICESELDQHLKDLRKLLKKPRLEYQTISAVEYLIEVPVREAKTVPPKWVKISQTKTVVRFHTPEILRITQEREQHKETLAGSSRRAVLSFQSDISEHHEFVVVSKQLAVIDCLMSLAQVAAASGYCKPTFVAQPCLHIRQGRHPMVEMLRDDAYVPFDIDFSEKDGEAKVITGPNMAGKSSCVRATALIVCMAQIGSFVPASSVTLGIHDAVQTRMGASDDIGRGKSTFMVELSETSDILRTLTPRTLVILDELGRGTSTYDGVAIAYATLSHLAGIGCNTLFVTHYPMVAEELAKEFPTHISNWHMSFSEIKLPDGSAEITFLYKLTRGLAEASFGVWCARLAGLPRDVLDTAQSRAEQLKIETGRRLLASMTRRTKRLLSDGDFSGPPAEMLRNAETLYKTLALFRKAS